MPSLFKQIQAGAIWDFHGGIHPPSRKQNTSQKPVAVMPLPDRLYIPLRQHIGVAGQLLVKAGERVLKGQPLTNADNSMTVPVHAPTSGTVLQIAPHTSPHPSALPELTLVLEPDGLDEWRERFGHWVAQGSPQDLLNASIYFDFRPLCGDVALAQALRADVTLAARNSPRFLKMLAHNALGRSVPLNWRGAIDTDEHGALDLKLQGTALFVDAARIYSLALGVHETNTRLRLEAASMAAAREQARQHLDQHDLAAELAQNGRRLQPDIAAADHHGALGAV